MSLDVTLTLDGDEVFSANITHNLTEMADRCGLYYCLWRPEEFDLTKARDVANEIRPRLMAVIEKEEVLKELNPSNGWGDYDGFLKFVLDYYRACVKYPDADVSACR